MRHVRASLQRHDGCEHSYGERKLAANHRRNGLLNQRSDDEWQQEAAEGIDTRVWAARQKATCNGAFAVPVAVALWINLMARLLLPAQLGRRRRWGPRCSAAKEPQTRA